MDKPLPTNPQWVTSLSRSRPMTWVAIVINAAFAFAMVYAIRAGAAQGWCVETYARPQRCGDRNIGEMVGPWWLLFAWVVVDVVLGIMWWFTRPTRSR